MRQSRTFHTLAGGPKSGVQLSRRERLLRGESRYSLARHGGEVGGLIADLEPWLREKLGLISQKSKPGEAVRYGLTR